VVAQLVRRKLDNFEIEFEAQEQSIMGRGEIHAKVWLSQPTKMDISLKFNHANACLQHRQHKKDLTYPCEPAPRDPGS
jgi:hypothetical protein